MPQKSGPARDRWVRELVGSIVDRTAPVLLDRADTCAALDLSDGQFAVWLRSHRLENRVCVDPAGRELYRSAEVRAFILAAA